MNRINKLLLITLLPIGLILGPGYLLYTPYFSGKTISTHSMYQQEVSHAGSVRSNVTATSGEKWSDPVEVELSPEMNPIRIQFKAKHVGTASSRRSNQYTATLKSHDDVVWKEGFKLTSKKKDKDNVSFGTSSSTSGEVHTFDIETAGPYSLQIIQNGKGQITVSDLFVTFKRNVAIPNRKIAGGGFICLVIGIVLIFIGGRRSS